MTPRPRRRVLPVSAAAALALTAVAGCRTAPSPRPVGDLDAPPRVAHGPRTSSYDVEHYALELDLDPAKRTLDGVCRIRLWPKGGSLERVTLDLAGLEVFSVADGAGRSLGFRHMGEKLHVDLAESLPEGSFVELAVTYGGSPAKGLWFAGDDGGAATHVFTQGACEDSRWWFPCWDALGDRATSEVRVTMPAHWTSVAAGERVDRFVGAERATEHWRMATPHPTYLVTLVAGDFVVQEDEWDGVPLLYLAERGYGEYLDASFHETDEVLDYFSELTGLRYPYPKYSQACVDNFPYGGMENISATTLTRLTLDDERGNRDRQSHGLVAHEAAHQWFGDLITCDEWAHVWLNEGFATYLTLLYFEHSRGVDEFRARLRDAQEDYLEADVGDGRRPVVWNVYREPVDLFGEHVYPGAAVRLHLLRDLLGDEVFFSALRTYVAENAGRNVVTADFRRAAEKVSGLDLDLFFEQWFESPGFPELEVEWTWDEATQVVQLDVAQRQAGVGGTPHAFHMDVDVEVRDPGGVTVHRVEIDERTETFELPAALRPVWVRFDKHGAVPKRLDAKKAPEEWLAIAVRDDDVNGRRDAVRALGDLAEDASERRAELYVAELTNRLRRDSSRWVRAEAARSLGRAGGIEARRNLLWAAAGDDEAPVRTACLEALCAWGRDDELADAAAAAFDEAFSYDCMIAAAKLRASARPGDAFGWLSGKLRYDSPHDQLRAGLLDLVAELDAPGAGDLLLQWAADTEAHPQARRAAVRALPERARSRRDALDTLTAILDEDGWRLRGDALRALGRIRDKKADRVLEEYYERTVFPRERRIIEAAFTPGGGRP